MTDRTPIVTIPAAESPLRRIEPERPSVPANCPHQARMLLDQLGVWEPEARLHTSRVGDMATAFGCFIGLGTAALATTSLAAHLHDIGKLKTPVEILTKPDPLTDGEYAVIKNHASDGADLLKSAGVNDDIVAIVRSHHEWWDGRGYPAGLSREEIPMAARLIAVVDAWDAISAHRTYHRRRTEFVALSEIRKGSGTQFDPHYAMAFIDFACERLMEYRRCA
jgi:putative nucleotidyltransferase with HDIG domain